MTAADSPSTPSGRAYEGAAVTIYFEGKRCRHFAECLRGLPAVFDTAARPWIQPDNASADEVSAIVARCPSGALHAVRADGVAEAPDDPTSITSVEGGPLLLRGNLLIETPDGPVHDTRATLCQCGKTSRTPFCDGACQAS
jgi:uncharacterized Fe-S cluster protein YjdI